jgi:hypothetical protein
MRFELRLRGGVVGWSDPVEIDRAAAIGHGPFAPGPIYPLVEPVFRLWARARAEPDPVVKDRLVARYAAERSALPFQLCGPDGAVWPTTSIHVVDLRSPAGEGTLELEVRFGAGAFA